MKTFLLLAFVGMMVFMPGRMTAAHITVENTLDFDRKGELTEVPVSMLGTDFIEGAYVLRDSKGKEIPYQLSKAANVPVIIFQADVKAKSKSVYTLEKGTPAKVEPKTYARFVPERKDDFAWENEFAAFRMYGPALANEYPSNGVDIWMKRSEGLIVDRIYSDRLNKNLSYHEDNGVGLDCYDVKHSMGAGGIAPYTSRLWIGDQFSSYKIEETGALRCVFTLIYDTVRVEDSYYVEKITITTEAGSLLNRAVVSFSGKARQMNMAGGFVLHDEEGKVFHDKDNSVIAYSEKAVSNKGVPQGRTYIGVYMPGGGDTLENDNHYVITKDYKAGSELEYYFGGGWSKWGFPENEDWFGAMVKFSQSRQYPLNVSVGL